MESGESGGRECAMVAAMRAWSPPQPEPLGLFERGAARPLGGRPRAAPRLDEGTGPGRRWLCRRCRAFLATAADELAMNGAVRHEHTNPAGWVCRFLTVARCANAIPTSVATVEYTWFAGYAWEVLGCEGCRAHLGWRY